LSKSGLRSRPFYRQACRRRFGSGCDRVLWHCLDFTTSRVPMVVTIK
jgi:hypothetical protein